MRSAFRSMPVRVAIVAVATLTALGALAYAGAQPRSLETSPQEFLESIGLLQEESEEPEEDESGDGEGGFDPAPLREGSEASENASETAISVLTVIEAWLNGEFDSGCEFGQAVSAAARGEEEAPEVPEDGEEDAVDPCERNGEESSGAGRGEEMSAVGKARGQAAAEAGKARGAEASAAGKAKAGDAPGRGASNGGGGGGSGPPLNPGPPPGAGPPGGTPGGP